MKIIPLTAAVAAAALVAASCGGGGDDSADTTVETTTTSTTSTTVPPTTAPPTTEADRPAPTTTIAPDAPRQPLTGEPLDDEADIIDRPALAVKIDNAPPARPNHSGLAVADIVIEEVVEGDLTRFIAIFHSNDSDPVGPVRSGRSQDVDLLTSFREPLFAWSGGNPGVRRLIRNSTLVDLDAGFNDLYYRGPGAAPHDLYSSTEVLFEATPEDHPGAPPQQFRYLSAGEFEGDLITDIDLDVGQIDVQWEWDPDEERWLRSQEGAPHVDSVHGRIAFTNVILMGVEYGRSAIDVTSPEARTVGEGPAFFLSDGKLAQGTWARLTAEAPITFFDETGEAEVELTPGNTWIELPERAPTGDEDDPWTVDFSFVEAP